MPLKQKRKKIKSVDDGGMSMRIRPWQARVTLQALQDWTWIGSTCSCDARFVAPV